MALLGTTDSERAGVKRKIVEQGHILNDSQQQMLELKFTENEIKSAIFSIPDDKAPGLDGYSSAFYKATWNVIGPEITRAVK